MSDWCVRALFVPGSARRSGSSELVLPFVMAVTSAVGCCLIRLRRVPKNEGEPQSRQFACFHCTTMFALLSEPTEASCATLRRLSGCRLLAALMYTSTVHRVRPFTCALAVQAARFVSGGSVR